MYCNKCGKEISDDSKYCSNCGAKIDSKDSKPYYDQRIKVDTNGYEFNIPDKKKFYFKYFLIGLIPFFGMIYLRSYMLKEDKERAKVTSLYIGNSTFVGIIFIAIFITILFLVFKSVNLL